MRIHHFDLDSPPLDPRELASFADRTERDRASRFHRDSDRVRFVNGRGLLRAVLGREMGLHPRAVPIRYGEYGRPHVDQARDHVPELAPGQAPGHKSGQTGVPTFSVSHTERLYAVAVARTVGAIGLDIEAMRAFPDPHGVSRQVFVDQELEQVLPVEDQHGWSRFYSFWTAKEAALKALGTGFSLEATRLRVDFDGTDSFTVHPHGPQLAGLPLGGTLLKSISVPGSDTSAVVSVVAEPWPQTLHCLSAGTL